MYQETYRAPSFILVYPKGDGELTRSLCVHAFKERRHCVLKGSNYWIKQNKSQWLEVETRYGAFKMGRKH